MLKSVSEVKAIAKVHVMITHDQWATDLAKSLLGICAYPDIHQSPLGEFYLIFRSTLGSSIITRRKLAWIFEKTSVSLDYIAWIVSVGSLKYIVSVTQRFKKGLGSSSILKRPNFQRPEMERNPMNFDTARGRG